MAVNRQEPDVRLVTENQESGINNWPLVATRGHEMASLAAGRESVRERERGV